MLATALSQTLAALDSGAAYPRLAAYYDRGSAYSGTLFLDIEPNRPDAIEASDLYAVTTLSMTLDARHGRLLLDPGTVRDGVRSDLRGLDPSLPIQYLDIAPLGSAETLQRMWDLHFRLRRLLGETRNWWVFAAKLSARKRPSLFPVRDHLVCQYLSDGRPLCRDSGWPGDFSVDMQVYAYLMSHQAVRGALGDLSARLTDNAVRADDVQLRLLDSALWTAAAPNATTT